MPSLTGLRVAGVLLTTVLALLLIGPAAVHDRVLRGGAGESRDAAGLTGAQPEGPVLAGADVARGALGGDLGSKKRDRAVAEVADLVDAWLASTYLQADAGRRDASSGLTRRLASAAARRDEAILRAPALTDPVAEVRKRKISVDLLATRGRARAATARVRLVIAPAGAARTVSVRGRLFLLMKDGRWRIFGYDLAKGR